MREKKQSGKAMLERVDHFATGFWATQEEFEDTKQR